MTQEVQPAGDKESSEEIHQPSGGRSSAEEIASSANGVNEDYPDGEVEDSPNIDLNLEGDPRSERSKRQPDAKRGNEPRPDSGGEPRPDPGDQNDEKSGGNGEDGPPPETRGNRDDRPFYLIMVFLSLIVLLLIILALGSNSGPRAQVPEIESAPVVNYPPAEFFVQDQVIVSGPEGAVEDVTEELRETGLISRVDRLKFAKVLKGEQCPGLSGRPNDGQDLVIDLYDILGEDLDVASVIRQIQNGQVIAEPNWINGSPWEIEGSPWEIEGSPWEIEGSSDDAEATIASARAIDSMSQWAFQVDAIDLLDPPVGYESKEDRVLVGVFDTLPFSTPISETTRISVAWVTEPRMLSVTAFRLEPNSVLSDSEKGPSFSMDDHGLYVAGLVHAVAPNSKIELIRVLDSTNRGDLFLLNKSILNFMQRMKQGGRENGVINLSLGIRIPPLNAPGFEDFSRQVASLQDSLALAHCSGIVVVAAAGNNSAGDSPPELANLPAAWPSVIGVAASNSAHGRACFSNRGDIGAPGGEGRETDGDTEICRPRNNECKGPTCPFAVIGPISQTTTSSSGFAFWTGSSFAAPMVSGLAARVLEAGAGNFTPDEVRDYIECGVTKTADRYLGAGVINVRRTLEECLPTGAPVSAE